MRQQTGAGLKVFCRIFGVDPDLNRATPRLNPDFFERRHFAGGLLHHPLHQVHPGDFFGDAVFDLQAGVHFEKVMSFAGVVVDKLNRAGRLIRHRLPQPHCRFEQLFANLGGQSGRGSFFDDLLIAALHRAIALTESEDRSFPVAEDLHFDVPRFGDEFLKIKTAAAKTGLTLTRNDFERFAQLFGRSAQTHADAAATSGALQHGGIADLLGGH